jgi:hypothetical protein
LEKLWVLAVIMIFEYLKILSFENNTWNGMEWNVELVFKILPKT